MGGDLTGGAAAVDITPAGPVALAGYPFIERVSTGTHDPLLASAIVLERDGECAALCSLDLLFVTKAQAAAIRGRVADATGLSPGRILVAATHTHSGPVTVRTLNARDDPTVPEPDADYVAAVVDRAAQAIVRAYESRHSVEAAVTTIDAAGIGGNRRSPGGAADPEVPVLVVRNARDLRIESLSLVHCMHPTVLHEDSTLVSADYPGAARSALARGLGARVVVAHFTGPEGNQSPRHFLSANTFEEAERLGGMLAERVLAGVRGLGDDDFTSSATVAVAQGQVALTRRAFPPVQEAVEKRDAAEARLASLREEGAPAPQIRTAECDWFGARELVSLCEGALRCELDAEVASDLPAEVQVVRIGETCFVALPGELFVEYSLAIKAETPMRCFVMCLANGLLHGYVVTPEAYAEGGYEASNGVFAPDQGAILIREALRLVERSLR